ncbi:hypothetical protein [Terriglobus roseus]|uniref:hypothetical protein n=1 Tax=Terriglobus roseus TaxID=392734 RepID=UPI00059F0A05|nr:hypothetical protein [Terriglobus roseus]
MQYSAILREIDAELHKLIQVRNILASTVLSASRIDHIRSKERPTKRVSLVRSKADQPIEDAPVQNALLLPTTRDTSVRTPEPAVTVLPPKQKREYRRAIKPFVPEPRALAAPRFNGVVVYMVPSSSTEEVTAVPASPLASPENLEAMMRQKLFGRQASSS